MAHSIIRKIVSGGQTGVDRAALDLAMQLGIEIGGWCPKGRWSEDGTIPERYPLEETPESKVEQRTEWNARDSDGTLIINFGPLTGGTLFTREMAEKYRKPCLCIEEAQTFSRQDLEKWLKQANIKILNVAGPRESQSPGKIYSRSFEILRQLLS